MQRALLIAFIVGVLIFVAGILFFFMRTHESTTRVPYVTDTEAFKEYIQNILRSSDAQTVQETIKEIYKDTLYSEQHMAFHYFGEVLYEEKGAEALPLCTDTYGFGCYHGFLLDAIDSEGNDIVPSLDAACRKRHGVSKETETCQHGIGHGLLEFFGRDPERAIAACDRIDDVFPKLGCASGVFMEYFNPTESQLWRKTLQLPVYDESSPFNVCTSFSGDRFATCLFEIQSWWYDAGLTPLHVERLCSSVEDQNAREFCFIGYGNYHGPYIERALPFCDELTENEHQMLCRAGAFWAAAHNTSSGDPERACEGLEEEQRAQCREKGSFMCEIEDGCEL